MPDFPYFFIVSLILIPLSPSPLQSLPPTQIHTYTYTRNLFTYRKINYWGMPQLNNHFSMTSNQIVQRKRLALTLIPTHFADSKYNKCKYKFFCTVYSRREQTRISINTHEVLTQLAKYSATVINDLITW